MPHAMNRRSIAVESVIGVVDVNDMCRMASLDPGDSIHRNITVLLAEMQHDRAIGLFVRSVRDAAVVVWRGSSQAGT